MAALTGKNIKNTYKDLVQVSNSNSGIDATDRPVSDGEGTDSPLLLSTTNVTVADGTDSTKRVTLDVSGVTTATTRTITVQDSSDTMVCRATTDTLTNKSVDLTNNTVTGTTAEFNTALSDGSFATLAGTETLTNKTFDLTDNTLAGTLAELSTAISDATVASTAGTETLTNKTIDLTDNTVTGTLAELNTAVSDATLVSTTGTETLSSKTLTSPVLNGTLSGTAFLDEDTLSSDSAIAAASQQSIKAYVDANALGKVVQVVTGTTTTETSTTTTMVFDDTIPQNTEGHEIMTLAITPTNSSNKLIIEYSGFFSHSTAAICGHALYQDSTASALAATGQSCDAGTRLYEGRVRHVMTAGTTSSTTFKVRGGGNTGTFYSLQNGSNAMFGGVNLGIFTIYEIEV